MSELPVELECPGIGGSSGIVDNHLCNLFVKRSGVTPGRFVMVSGTALKRSAENNTPIYLKSRTEIKTALKNTTPVLSTAITTFSQIKEVYYRLTHKEEGCVVGAFIALGCVGACSEEMTAETLAADDYSRTEVVYCTSWMEVCKPRNEDGKVEEMVLLS
ncbi:uncharacterized protein LOC123500297 [Portunus trituberculatus]|uniref:uncharacterized protein LOC123500297 n=1 Tax=Portunus trituberculatus TaxID=210409 RepID=UPI001E1D1688|nr:uncharacterized protein LOC123500297 [Portunus trituberculatus]